jgi:hypothetical protein
MKVETVKDEDYLGIKVFRFYFKCTQCYGEITFKTDPKNHDYVAEWGASRNHEQWKDLLMAEEEFKDIKQSEMKEDAMKSLEHRTYDSKREMDILDALDQVKTLNRRQMNVNYDDLIEKAVLEKDKEDLKEEEMKVEEIAKEKFKKLRQKRIEDYNMEDMEKIFLNCKMERDDKLNEGNSESDSDREGEIKNKFEEKNNHFKNLNTKFKIQAKKPIAVNKNLIKPSNTNANANTNNKPKGTGLNNILNAYADIEDGI